MTLKNIAEGSAEDVAYSKELLAPMAQLALAERQAIPRSRSTSTEPGDENGNGGSVEMDAASASSSSADSDAPIPSYADPLQFFYTGDDPICDQVGFSPNDLSSSHLQKRLKMMIFNISFIIIIIIIKHPFN